MACESTHLFGGIASNRAKARDTGRSCLSPRVADANDDADATSAAAAARAFSYANSSTWHIVVIFSRLLLHRVPRCRGIRLVPDALGQQPSTRRPAGH